MILDGPSRVSGAQTNYNFCPHCGDNGWHFYVSNDNGKYICFKCDARGQDAIDWAVESKELDVLLATPNPAHVWSEIELPAWVGLSLDADRYLANRGISQDQARKLGLVNSAAGPRILIPYFSSEGVLVYWTARSYVGTDPKYRNAPGIPHPLYFADAKMTGDPVLVEGPFDAIRVCQAGYQGIAIGGKTLAHHLEKPLLRELRNYNKVTVMLDSDALDKADELARWIGEHVDTVVDIACPPAGQDPGSMSLEDLKFLLENE